MNQPHEAAAAISARLIDRLGHVWWVFMTRGIIAVVFGIITLIWPPKSRVFLGWLAGQATPGARYGKALPALQAAPQFCSGPGSRRASCWLFSASGLWFWASVSFAREPG